MRQLSFDPQRIRVVRRTWDLRASEDSFVYDHSTLTWIFGSREGIDFFAFCCLIFFPDSFVKCDVFSLSILEVIGLHFFLLFFIVFLVVVRVVSKLILQISYLIAENSSV